MLFQQQKQTVNNPQKATPIATFDLVPYLFPVNIKFESANIQGKDSIYLCTISLLTKSMPTIDTRLLTLEEDLAILRTFISSIAKFV